MVFCFTYNLVIFMAFAGDQEQVALAVEIAAVGGERDGGDGPRVGGVGQVQDEELRRDVGRVGVDLVCAGHLRSNMPVGARADVTVDA